MLSHFKKWMLYASLLLAALAAYPPAHAQTGAKYISVFANGLTGSGTCNLINRMSCLATPSSASFYGESPVNDLLLTLSPTTNLYKNAVYSNSGSLLFSVDEYGIYAPDAAGTEIFSFADSIYFDSTSFSCPSSLWSNPIQ